MIISLQSRLKKGSKGTKSYHWLYLLVILWKLPRDLRMLFHQEASNGNTFHYIQNNNNYLNMLARKLVIKGYHAMGI